MNPPYHINAAYCCDLQEALHPRVGHTSANPTRTQRDLRGRRERYELIGKPHHLNDVVAAVQRAVDKAARGRASG